MTILVKFPFAERAWALPALVALDRCVEKVPAEGKTKAKEVKDRAKAKAKRRARDKAQAPTATRRHKTPRN